MAPGTVNAAEIVHGLAVPFATTVRAVPMHHRTHLTAGIGASDGEESAQEEMRLYQPQVPTGSNCTGPDS